MPIQLKERSEGRLVELKATGKITAYEYARLVPEFDLLGRQHAKLRVLFQLHEFQGWEPGSLWKDLTLEVRHFANIDRLAIIGEARWEESMTTFCKLFTVTGIRFFTINDTDLAREWISVGYQETRPESSHVRK